MSVATIRWEGERSGHVVLLDQTRLPLEVATLEIRTLEAMVDAIRRLAVRGAPAIGLAGAFGLVIALQEMRAEDADDLLPDFRLVFDAIDIHVLEHEVGRAQFAAVAHRAALEECGGARCGKLLRCRTNARGHDERPCRRCGCGFKRFPG